MTFKFPGNFSAQIAESHTSSSDLGSLDWIGPGLAGLGWAGLGWAVAFPTSFQALFENVFTPSLSPCRPPLSKDDHIPTQITQSLVNCEP